MKNNRFFDEVLFDLIFGGGFILLLLFYFKINIILSSALC